MLIPFRIGFKTPGWNVTHDLNVSPLTIRIVKMQMCVQTNAYTRQNSIEIKPTTGHNHSCARKCNHGQIIQSWGLSMKCSDHLTLKINMKILKEIISLITSFNKLHGYQSIRSTYHAKFQTILYPSQLVFGRDMIISIAFKEKMVL
jgi:hypothetical protein